jgi:hypothetical protein
VVGADDLHPRVARGGALGDFAGLVGRAVVPDEQLEVAIRLPRTLPTAAATKGSRL